MNAVGELESKQEEADTKVFLCSKFANEMGFGSIRIITVDSDVAILSLYYQQQLRYFWSMALVLKHKSLICHRTNLVLKTCLKLYQDYMLFQGVIPPVGLMVLGR